MSSTDYIFGGIVTCPLITCPNCGDVGRVLAQGECRPCHTYRRHHNAPRPASAPLRDPMDAYPMDWRIQQACAKARQFYGLRRPPAPADPRAGLPTRAGAGRRGPPALLIFPPPPTTEDTHSNEGAAGSTRKEHHAR